MILLFSDYGQEGPYLGQVESVLSKLAPDSHVINLLADCPRQDPRSGSYLLRALSIHMPEEAIVFAVVDPGVGNFNDQPIVLRLAERWYVGPDNGLFDMLCREAATIDCWKIHWRPERLSNTFHGRDLYAPVAAMLANGMDIPGERIEWQDKHGWPDELAEIIYIDHFGNCMSGLRGDSISNEETLIINDKMIPHAKTFSDVRRGEIFWYQNSLGLLEISVNQGSASAVLKLSVGSRLAFE